MLPHLFNAHPVLHVLEFGPDLDGVGVRFYVPGLEVQAVSRRDGRGDDRLLARRHARGGYGNEEIRGQRTWGRYSDT